MHALTRRRAMPLDLCVNCARVVTVMAVAAANLGSAAAGVRALAPACLSAAAPQGAAPAINFRERPRYPSDAQRMRRTVQIDGVQGDGEWQPFYTIDDGPIHGTFYCNWDEHYLYLAARTEQPATVLFDVDTNGDGWLRGADNLEVVVGGIADAGGPSATVRVLDAASNKDTPAWVDRSADAKSMLVAGKITNGVQFVEVAIPAGVANLTLRPGAGIGLRAEFLPAGPPAAVTPTVPFEPHLLLDATLVESRTEASAGVVAKLTLSDNKCVPGEKLFATLTLTNETDIPVSVRSVTWSGQGDAANAINTLREVSVDPVPGLKFEKLPYSTKLPADLPLGTYTLLATAELPQGRQVQSAASFTVVEPLQVQMSSEPQPLNILGPSKVTVSVDVYSNVPNHMTGDVELTGYPTSWVLQGKPRHNIPIDRQFAQHAVRFTFKVPSTTPAGDYPVDAVVRWKGKEWRTHYIVHAIRTDAPAPGKAGGQ